MLVALQPASRCIQFRLHDATMYAFPYLTMRGDVPFCLRSRASRHGTAELLSALAWGLNSWRAALAMALIGDDFQQLRMRVEALAEQEGDHRERARPQRGSGSGCF
eukprot:2558622-Pleurochrysis_carterae.AAC.2